MLILLYSPKQRNKVRGFPWNHNLKAVFAINHYNKFMSYNQSTPLLTVERDKEISVLRILSKDLIEIIVCHCPCYCQHCFFTI